VTSEALINAVDKKEAAILLHVDVEQRGPLDVMKAKAQPQLKVERQ
jgi:hypothetical protein